MEHTGNLDTLQCTDNIDMTLNALVISTNFQCTDNLHHMQCTHSCYDMYILTL